MFSHPQGLRYLSFSMEEMMFIKLDWPPTCMCVFCGRKNMQRLKWKNSKGRQNGGEIELSTFYVTSFRTEKKPPEGHSKDKFPK